MVKKSNIGVVTTIRLTEGLDNFIKKDVSENKIHRDRTDWIMCAIIRYMDVRLEQMKNSENIIDDK